jgi:hypothetical protein
MGKIVDGEPIKKTFATARSFVATPTYLMADGIDNDDDSLIDEPDDDVYQILSVGSYRGSTRRLVAYIGITVTAPPVMDAAEATMDPNVTVDTNGDMRMSGFNRNMDGTLVGSGDTAGLAITAPGSLADRELPKPSWMAR